MATDVQMRAGAASQRLWFEGAGLARDDVRVEAIEGREAISRPYRFEATFVSGRAIKASAVVGQRGKLGIDVASDTLTVSGVILELHAEDPTAAGDFVYRMILVPRFKLLEFSRQNQIYGSQAPVTLPDIIRQELDGSLAKQSSHGGGREDAVESELRLTGSYRSRDYVVQHEETDLAFLSRICEHAGIFFFFEQHDEGEKMIFGDANVAFTAADLPAAGLPYRHIRQVSMAEDRAVTSFRCEARALPGRVYLREYNEMMPSAELLSQADVTADGFGIIVEYGQYFRTPEEGSRLAKVRAEEIACRGRVFHGISTAPQLRPGYVFSVTEHPDSEMDGRYVVTEVTHEASAPIALGQDSGVAPKPYRNRFEAVPFSVAFRPQRVTPKPVAAGIYNATVDGQGSGDRAELDEHGRYKLRLFYDEGTSPDGKASEFVRKAEPYVGKNDSGMHFPLLKDTEVVLAFVNGDPDRPIIVGAVPNPLTPSVVSRDNHTRNRIASTSGILFEIEDGPAGGASGGSPGIPAQNHYAMSVAAGADGQPHAGALQAKSETVSTADQSLPLQDHFDASGADPADYEGTTQFARISVPGAAQSYLRLGALADTDTSTWPTDQMAQSSVAAAAAGDSAQDIYEQTRAISKIGAAADYTDGILIGTTQHLMTDVTKSVLTRIGEGSTTLIDKNDYKMVISTGALDATAQQGIYMTAGDAGTPSNINLTAYGYVRTKSIGDSHVWSQSNSYTYIEADKIQEVIGTNDSTTHGLNKSTVYGRDESYKIGGRLAINVGSGISIFVAVDMKMFAGGDISWGIFNLKMVTGADTKFVLGVDLKMVTTDVKLVTVSKYEIAPSTNKLDGMKISMAGIISEDTAAKAKKAAAAVEATEAKAMTIQLQGLISDFYGIA